jgi:hypothetical protein
VHAAAPAVLPSCVATHDRVGLSSFAALLAAVPSFVAVHDRVVCPLWATSQTPIPPFFAYPHTPTHPSQPGERMALNNIQDNPGARRKVCASCLPACRLCILSFISSVSFLLSFRPPLPCVLPSLLPSFHPPDLPSITMSPSFIVCPSVFPLLFPPFISLPPPFPPLFFLLPPLHFRQND